MTNRIMACGVWFYARDTKQYLYLMRNDERHPQSWSLPGGKVDPGETLIQAIERECQEELGQMPAYLKLIPLERFTSADGLFTYDTFFCAVDQEFQPSLNHEHLGYAWLAGGINPRPMHPGLWSTVNFEAVQQKILTIQQNL